MDFDRKHLLVFRTRFIDHDIFRNRAELTLQIFQQFALVVRKIFSRNDFLHTRKMELVQNRTNLFDATIQVDGAKNRFVGVSQDAFLAATAEFFFGFAYLHIFAQAPFLGRLRAGMPRNNRALALGKFTFRIVGVSLVEKFRRKHVQHGIAQELQAFVVAHVGQVRTSQERAVHQCVRQEFRILEPVPELRLKPAIGLLAKPEFKHFVEKSCLFHMLQSFEVVLWCHLERSR